jgi:hypothetical protein
MPVDSEKKTTERSYGTGIQASWPDPAAMRRGTGFSARPAVPINTWQKGTGTDTVQGNFFPKWGKITKKRAAHGKEEGNHTPPK